MPDCAYLTLDVSAEHATTVEHRPGVPQPHTGLPPAPWAVIRDGRIVARYYSREMAEWSANLHQEQQTATSCRWCDTPRHPDDPAGCSRCGNAWPEETT